MITNTEILNFVTYCIAQLAHRLHLSQQEIYRRLKDSGILYDYIVPSYDVLHTFGSRYLIDDLTDFMREKGVLETSSLIEEGVSDLYCLKQSHM